MKFKSIGRAVLATGMSLAIGFGATACSRDYTVAYVYATSLQSNEVSAYAVDYQSGALTQINGSPFTGTGNEPVAIVPAPNGKFLYVIANQTSNVTEYAIGTDGKLYGQNTYTTTGTFPTAAAIDSTGSYLYVTFTYQSGFSTASPGPGGVTIFKINSDNSLTTVGTANVGNNPVSIAVSNPICSVSPLAGTDNPACTGNNGAGYENIYVYVLDQETQTSPPASIIGFSSDTKTGALTLLSNSVFSKALNTYQGYPAGTKPTAIAIEPTSTYVYVTDGIQSNVYGYQIAGGAATAGNLTALTNSPFIPGTGSYPINLTIDPRGKYLFTANQASSTVSSFTINLTNGSLGLVGTSAPVGTRPTCVTVEPALGIYLYTSNSVDGTISGEQLNANTGALSAIPNTPFPSSALPSCITSVANGSHAQSIDVD
ncbi:beta-propeller fold lactonase family protein [Granulicella sp. S156]|uniref:lactonase family protein n=1 Tax=Granulicella sp. S156 TaxID=1747224 RepID=UPI00131ADDFF|nr:beta-propeller fold lactonase family protein [Granulicella sp. S156]